MLNVRPMPSVFQHIFYLLWQTLQENYKNICDSCWYYFLCILWTFSGFIINKGVIFTIWNVTPNDIVSHHMIISPCVNANHVLSYLLVSTDHSYGRKYLTTLKCWKAIFKFYWFIWYLTIKQTFFLYCMNHMNIHSPKGLLETPY